MILGHWMIVRLIGESAWTFATFAALFLVTFVRGERDAPQIKSIGFDMADELLSAR